MAGARTAALRILLRVDAGATLSDALVRERDRLADPRDRALTTEIATGTLRWRGALDAAIAAAAGRPLGKIDRVVLAILRSSAYQLIYLDRIPARAVVHDAVALTRTEGHASAAGFTNAVLRRLARAREAGAVDPPRDHDLADLVTRGSHPAWLVSRWAARFGLEAARRWIAFNNQPARLALRVNRLKTSRDALQARLAAEGVATEPTAWAAHGLVVIEGNPLGGPSAADGWFLVQDEASQLVGECTAAWAGRRALDACAAPGGKTLALVEAAGESGLVVAADRRPRRLRLLSETLRRVADGRAPVMQIDLAQALPFAAAFDLVLVDAPCSGLGTVRREPDLKWRRTEDDLATFSRLQLDLLHTAARVVAPGGRLVYATCSSEPEENDEVAARFLGAHPGFRPAGAPTLPLPSRLGELVEPAGALRTSPADHGLEAFYAMAFERIDDGPPTGAGARAE